MPDAHYERFVTDELLLALSDTPVVAVNGPRQSGKSTLVGDIPLSGDVERVSLDDPGARAAAALDPRGFVERRVDCLVIDEVQLEPRLFRAMKAAVDRDRRPGRFLVTGSARLLSAPDMADALVGRVEIIELRPLSQGEIRGERDLFIDRLFDDPDDMVRSGGFGRDEYVALALAGGFPEIVRRPARRRDAWFANYATTVIQRVVSDLADLERLSAIPKLVRLLAARSGSTLNVTALSREVGIPAKTLDSYLALLSNTFLLRVLPAWSTNLSSKVVRAPKVYLVDSGLAAHLMGMSHSAATRPHPATGPVLETFVLGEIDRQLSWSDHQPSIWHFRDRNGSEVDIVLEHPDGRVVGIEVKASATVGLNDTKGLAFLRDRLGARFHRGVLLSAAPEALPIGDRLMALPVSALWAAGGMG